MPSACSRESASAIPAARRCSGGGGGGEPLVLGRDYFEHVFEWQDSQNRVFDNAVFTNLTLMDDDLAELFAEHDAHIYTSLDTTFPEHDVQRGGRCA